MPAGACPCRKGKRPGRALNRKYSTKWLTIKYDAAIFNHMVEDQALDDVFHALADPTRRAMLKRLAKSERTVGQLAEPFAISLAGASKHIKVLERAGLVKRRVEGRTHVCRLEAMPMHAGMEWMRHYERFWNERLDVLEEILAAEDAEKRKASDARTQKQPEARKGTKP